MPKQSDPKRQRLENVIGGILTIVLLLVLVICQRSTGWVQLGLMIACLLGLLGLVAGYNRRFR